MGISRRKQWVMESLQARVLLSASLPDLTYDNSDYFSGMPDHPVAGQFHWVSIDVINQQASVTGSFDISLYLSPTASFSRASSTFVGKTTFNGITSPEEASVGTNFPIVPPGIYYPVFVIDDGNKIAESDEDNNIAVGSAVQVDPATADFTLTNITGPESTTLTTGQECTVSVTGAVAGTTSESSISVGISLSSDKTPSDDDRSIAELYPSIDGSTFSGSTTFSLPSVDSGTYYVIATVDPAHDVAETDLSNDSIVGEQVNVHKSSIIHNNYGSTNFSGVVASTSSFPVSGYPISLTANLSDVDNGDPIPVKFSLSTDTVAGNADDVVIGTALTDPVNSPWLLAFNQYYSTSATFSGKLAADVPAGDYYLVASADGVTSRVGDKITVRVAKSTPDLSLSSLITSNDSTSGSTGTASATITNLSSFKSAPATLDLYYSIDDQLDPSDVLVTQFRSPAIDPASSQTVNFDFTVPETLSPGIYHPIAVLDPNNALADTDRSNNTAVATPLQIISGFDGTITAAGDTLLLKSKSMLTFVLSNQGTTSINNAYVANFYYSKDNTVSADDQLLLSKPIRAKINSNARGYFNFKYRIPANLPAGTGHVLVKLTEPKSDAAILTANTQVTVTDSASLLSGSAAAISSSARSTRFKITLTNTSSFNTQGMFNINLFDSDNQLIKTLKKSISIGAGKAKTISLSLRGQFQVGGVYSVQIDQL